MALGFSTLYIDQAAEWNSCLADRHGHQTPDEAMKKTYEWFGEATRRVRELCPEAYTVGELPDLYNTQSIDVWWDWGWRSNVATPVFRYLMPETMCCWCIDENERDVLSKAFALGDFLAIATCDMTGKLSDEPELAAQVAHLARLRKATAPFVSHGRFMDDRGLQVQGGDGYVYTSPRGLAVTLANGKPRATRMKVTLSPAALGRPVGAAATLFVEGERPCRVTPDRRGDALVFTVALPPYGAGVLTLAGRMA